MPTATIERLSDRRCRELLGSSKLGRLLFVERALPMVLPVYFTSTDDFIYLPVSRGGAWVEKLDGVLVAFAVDRIDLASQTGWSVLVHGTARLTTQPTPQLAIAIARISGERLRLTGTRPAA
jgi:nitroimidazol reductase NimA-like FMN-containing flavoprotein (pyridoxamine 5'-phosphate oxidase superfamily)